MALLEVEIHSDPLEYSFYLCIPNAMVFRVLPSGLGDELQVVLRFGRHSNSDEDDFKDFHIQALDDDGHDLQRVHEASFGVFVESVDEHKVNKVPSVSRAGDEKLAPTDERVPESRAALGQIFLRMSGTEVFKK